MPDMLENKTVKNLLADLEKRVQEKILEPNNLEFLKKLLAKAESEDEAVSICKLGTTFYKTGLVFDRKLEVPSDGAKILVKNDALSFENDGQKNTLIIGDNYDALLNLQVQYKNDIDVIYIDPPYGADSLGEFAKTNYQNQINRDNLLSMLQPRLTLAKFLLKDTGVIFCSIDDKNFAYVKCLFDEVFGEKNYAGTLVWQKKKKPSFLSKNFGTIFEYVICYVKDENVTFPFSVETTTVGKKYPFNNAGNSRSIIKFPAGTVHFNMPDCVVKAQNMSEGNIVTYLVNDVQIKDGINVNDFELDGEWRYNQKSLDEFLANNSLITIAGVPFRPNLVKDGGEIKKMKNFLSQTSYDCETNEDATSLLTSIFGDVIFDNPKPSGLVKLLLKATTYDNKNAKVLDFFAGSGTTGQAVLELNKEDEGNRSFILVQLPELLELDSKNPTTQNAIKILDKEGLPHSLDNITVERLRRIMKGETYTHQKNYEWISKNKAYGNSLNVFNIKEVSIFDSSIFDIIKEENYGLEAFNSTKEKVEWVCTNFEKVARKLKDVTRD